MDIVDVLGKYQLELLPHEWVSEIWTNQFSDPVDLPVEYEFFLENVPIRQLLNETCACVKQWLGSSEITLAVNSDATLPSGSSDASTLFRCSSISVESKSWQFLITSKVQHKALLCLLSTFIHQAKLHGSDENKRQVGLGATNLYFILLAIPGCKVYNIFNPVLYAQAIESLKTCTLLDTVNSKPSGSKKNTRNDEDSDDSDSSENEVVITGSGKVTLTKSLNILLNDVLYFLQRFQLKDETDSLVLTIQILVLITRLEKKVSNFLIHSPSQPSTTSLAHNAYIVLKNICDPYHGDVVEIVRLIMQELLPNILIVDQRGSLITPKEATIIKDHSILFIKRLLISIKEPAFLGTEALIQHLCIRIPDRAEARAKGVQIVYEVLSILPYTLYSKMTVWIMQLCHSDEVKHRITGLELVTKLLLVEERVNDSTDFQTSYTVGNEENSICERYSKFSTHKFLLATVFSRCMDVSATVRAKALSVIAMLITTTTTGIKQEVDGIFLHQMDGGEEENVYNKGIFDLHKFLLHFDIATVREFDPLPGAKAVFDLLETFIEDPKVFVRKSTLHVLANTFLINEKWITEQRLEIMETKCRDLSVSVRKMLIQCMSELLDKYPSHPKLPLYWVRGVFPLLSDQEIKSQEKVLEVLETLLLNNFVPFDRMKTPHHYLPWKLLDLIGELKMRKYLVFACHKWTVDKIIKQSTINIVRTHIGTLHNSAAWFFLSAVSEYMDIKDVEFAITYFKQHIYQASQIEEYCSQLVIEVLYLNWRQLKKEDQIDLCTQLLEELNLYSVPLPLIARYIDICHILTNHLSESKDIARERVFDWAEKLVKRSQKHLSKTIGPNSPEVVENEVMLAQHIFTLGDALQIAPSKEVSNSIKLLKNLLNHSMDDSENEETKQWQGTVGADVRAVAVITLGKMSLQNEKTAKKLVSLFGILLSTSKDRQIKINTMVALTDLCTKYTSLVERLLPDMCMCLKDNDLLVRENTLTLLIQLIQEDYLKLRCPLFFYLLCMMLDENRCIRDMMSVFIENSVLPKQKNIMVQHFVEGLFYYNAYNDHPAYSKIVKVKEHEAFSMAGIDKKESRRKIYRYMLEHMMDDHRFRVTYNICNDVLAGVVEGTVKLNEEGTAVLKDALYVLSSEEIRLSHLRPGGKDNDDDECDGGGEIKLARAITNMAKKTIISQVVKKNVIENIVPIIIQLKHKLKQLKSPLVKDLMEYLRELMKDYKDEINDILAADKELAAEVALDLESTEPETSEEDSGDELSKVVSSNSGDIRHLIMSAVVQVERLSASFASSSSIKLNQKDNQLLNKSLEANSTSQKDQEMVVEEEQKSPEECEDVVEDKESDNGKDTQN